MQQVVERAEAVRPGPLRPTLPTGGVTKDAGAIPAVSGLRHEPTFKVPTRPDPSCRPRPLIRGDDLGPGTQDIPRNWREMVLDMDTHRLVAAPGASSPSTLQWPPTGCALLT